MHAVVTEAPAPLVVLIRLVVSGDIVMAREGVAVAAARPAVHGPELVARPERFVVVERRTTLALSGTEEEEEEEERSVDGETLRERGGYRQRMAPSPWPEVASSTGLVEGPE